MLRDETAMPIVISALHFEWRDLEHCFQRVREEFQLDGVELSWHDGCARPHCTRADLELLARLGPASGLELGAHLWEDLARLGPGPAEQSLLRWLDQAVATGTSTLVIHGGSYDDQREGLARTRGILEGVLPQYEAAGVVLALENHYAFDYRDCHELFSEVWEFREVLSLDSPSLRFCFDTGHAHMTANSDSLLGELGPWLHHVHLADNCGQLDDHLMYGRGTVPFERIFATIEAQRYAGTWCVEFPVRDDLAPFEACRRRLRARRS